MAGFLIFLFFAALVGGVIWVWYIWRSRFGGRTMEYDAREMAFVVQAQADLSPNASPKAAPARDPAATIVNPAAVVAPMPDLKKSAERPAALLDQAGSLIYLQLKSCVGEYPLLVGVDIARLLPGTQSASPRVHADFVVCRKDFTPVVAIFLEHGASDPLRERAAQLLKQSRIRLLHWEANAVPDRETMRQQIFKSKASASA
ncbi:hypothetical protein [Uliginosibacterium gangwonense]|uniref:hypothetical protein n=1 Tax=Uliginosibacterium gangwonense TaxID=392736 RepID=UPI0003818E2B|nr:hypothetical protein [Uliginosibacterium gangwonense]